MYKCMCVCACVCVRVSDALNIIHQINYIFLILSVDFVLYFLSEKFYQMKTILFSNTI